jgi:gliding motility-associated protein GldC
MSKQSQIKFTIHLDEKNMPEKIEWQADDAGFEGTKETKTLLLSIWDKQDKVTLGIDLWTNEMLVDEMNIHYHQVFVKLAETYKNSTGNNQISEMIKKFAAEFAEKLNLFDDKT